MSRGLALSLLLVTNACYDDPSVDSTTLTIVSGTMDVGDPATVYIWLGQGSCSGTLVSPKTILTAKHCIEGVTAGDVSVFFGTQSDGDGTWINATRLLGHGTADIAMIALNDAGPTPWIPLNKRSLGSAHMGQEVRIVGFGVTGETRTDSGLKREGMTALYQLQEDVMFVGNAGSKTCYGDSGGPAFMRFEDREYVAGVTSFGTDVCEQGLSGEIRVDMYTPWIESFIEDNDPASCGSDTRCLTGCAAPDPDCSDPGVDPEGEDPGTESPGEGEEEPGVDPGSTEPVDSQWGVVTGGCDVSAGGSGGAAAAALLLLGLASLRLARRPTRARRRR